MKKKMEANLIIILLIFSIFSIQIRISPVRGDHVKFKEPASSGAMI